MPQKCFKWILAIGVLLSTNYLTMIYFTAVEPTPFTPTLPKGKRMATAKHASFPYNANYYQKKPGNINLVNVKPPTVKPSTQSEDKTLYALQANKTETIQPNVPATKTPVNKLPLYKPPVNKLSTPQLKKSIPAKAETQSNETKLILAWTSLTARKPLWGIKPCSQCEITGNRSLLDSADLLLFRIRELKPNLKITPYRTYVNAIDFTDLPVHHKAGQMWMDINQVSIYSVEVKIQLFTFLVIYIYCDINFY